MVRINVMGYQKAIEIYEEIARPSLNNNLLKYGIRGHLLNAGICQLCKGDVVAITNALERYQELDPTFSGTREYKLLTELAAAMDEEDVAKFTDAVKEFDSMTKLYKWLHKVLDFICRSTVLGDCGFFTCNLQDAEFIAI
ncbi:alpha-soluble NSF attachment protein [Helianthus annuus]|uniref:alpha-soluble NSF attachment protein n=1 Tax=Helianthus annuus TaxID=4232 RepID=UPI000B8FB13F|nr:alpha-soluble NSF attachment protein [Helianthus annuus]